MSTYIKLYSFLSPLNAVQLFFFLIVRVNQYGLCFRQKVMFFSMVQYLISDCEGVILKAKPTSGEDTPDNASELCQTFSREDLSALLGDLCQFTCFWCKFECNSYNVFCQHVRYNHGFQVSPDLLKDDAESHAKKLVLTKCKICQDFLPHDSYCIREHLIGKHKDPTLSFEKHLWNYLAMHQPNLDKSAISTKVHILPKTKCSVIVKTSKHVQYFKDKMNRTRVAFVLRKDIDLRKYDLNSVCFGSKNQTLPVMPTFEIGDLCLFKCRKCKLHITSFKMLVQHEPSCVGLKKSSEKRLICAYIQEARYHQCRICQKVILCDTHMIENHALKYHGMLFQEYMFRIPSKKTNENLASLSDVKFKRMQLTPAERETVPKESVTYDVLNLCNYKCDKCGFTINAFSKLRKHIKKCKRVGKYNFGYLVDAIFHDCKLCGVRMLCDKVPLWSHVNNIHKMKLKKYESLPKPNEPLTLVTGENKDQILKQLDNSTPSILGVDRSSVPSVEPLDKVTNPKGSLPNHLTTSKIGNYCLYACDKCDFRSLSLGGMGNHNKKSAHGPGNSTFNKKYVKEAKYHKWCIYGVMIFASQRIITP